MPWLLNIQQASMHLLKIGMEVLCHVLLSKNRHVCKCHDPTLTAFLPVDKYSQHGK